MGYETQMIIGVATEQEYEGIRYFMTYATIDMCKLGQYTALYDLDWCNETPDEPIWGFYAPAGDGNTSVTRDCYGDVPKPIPIELVIEALEKDMEDSDYRRLKWAHALLVFIQATTDGASVLLYGH